MLSDAEILRRARSVFVERGYGAPTREIAAAVGLSWPALVFRFGGKRELFRRSIVEPIRTPGRISLPAEGNDLRELLDRLSSLLGEKWPMRLQYRLAAISSSHDDGDYLTDWLSSALSSYVRRGAVRSDVPCRTLAKVVLALLEGKVAQGFMRRETPGNRADTALIDVAVAPLTPGSGSRRSINESHRRVT